MKDVVCRISDAEWLVINVVWQESPITATKIVEHLLPETNWSPKTIHTLISRLVKKGALGVNKEASLFRYYPLISKNDCTREETKSFLQKVYGGSLHLLVANFVKNESVSPQEIEDLRRLLDERLK